MLYLSTYITISRNLKLTKSDLNTTSFLNVFVKAVLNFIKFEFLKIKFKLTISIYGKRFGCIWDILFIWNNRFYVLLMPLHPTIGT